MVDLIPKQIWNWVLEGWRNMADLADKIDDLICSFEGGGDTTMDTLAMYMFGWMVFALVVLGIGKYVYGNFISGKDTKEKSIVAEPQVIKAENNVDATTKPIGKEVPATKSSGAVSYTHLDVYKRQLLGCALFVNALEAKWAKTTS